MISYVKICAIFDAHRHPNGTSDEYSAYTRKNNRENGL